MKTTRHIDYDSFAELINEKPKVGMGYIIDEAGEFEIVPTSINEKTGDIIAEIYHDSYDDEQAEIDIDIYLEDLGIEKKNHVHDNVELPEGAKKVQPLVKDIPEDVKSSTLYIDTFEDMNKVVKIMTEMRMTFSITHVNCDKTYKIVFYAENEETEKKFFERYYSEVLK